MQTIRKAYLGMLALTALVLVPGVASAQVAIPVEDIEDMGTDALTAIIPLIVSLGGIAVAVSAVFFGLRFVVRLVRSGGSV